MTYFQTLQKVNKLWSETIPFLERAIPATYVGTPDSSGVYNLGSCFYITCLTQNEHDFTVIATVEGQDVEVFPIGVEKGAKYLTLQYFVLGAYKEAELYSTSIPLKINFNPSTANVKYEISNVGCFNEDFYLSFSKDLCPAFILAKFLRIAPTKEGAIILPVPGTGPTRSYILPYYNRFARVFGLEAHIMNNPEITLEGNLLTPKGEIIPCTRSLHYDYYNTVIVLPKGVKVEAMGYIDLLNYVQYLFSERNKRTHIHPDEIFMFSSLFITDEIEPVFNEFPDILVTGDVTLFWLTPDSVILVRDDVTDVVSRNLKSRKNYIDEYDTYMVSKPLMVLKRDFYIFLLNHRMKEI